MVTDSEKRGRYLKRLDALKKERSPWDAHWRELAEYIRPRRSRFFAADTTHAGQKRNSRIINGAASIALRTLESGMMAGVTSPARPWFRLSVGNPDLAEQESVRAWLHVVEERIRDALAKSNTYKALHELYGDMGLFAPGVMIIEADTVNAVRAYNVPVGEYCLATSDRGQVDTLFRETQLTVGQLVARFGEESCSTHMQERFKRGDLDSWVEVVHVIEPRRDREPGAEDEKNKPFASCWFEKSGDATTGMLRESGYAELPFLAPRWTVTGNEVYGSSPAMDALGDIKALQLYERRKAQAIERIVDPPMLAPESMRGRPISMLPGDTTYELPMGASTQGVRPAIVIPPAAVQVSVEAIREHQERIRAVFYADIWLMLSQGEAPQMTAREVSERHEEKMLQLGPVMERLEDELLDPLVERIFGILLRSGRLPPPPPEMQDQELHVEYLSIMAQAQKLVATGGIERLVGFVGNMATAKPEVLDKINQDKVVDEYGDALGVNPEVIRSDDEVAQIRDQRAQAQQQAQQQEQAMAAAQGAKTLSQADTSSDNALTRMVGGVAAAQVGGAS